MTWFVFYSEPRAEMKAAQSIKDIGFDAFVPVERRIKRKPRRMMIESALFPRYGFIKLDLEADAWGLALAADGVIDLLKTNSIPSPVRSGIVEGLIVADNAGIFDHTAPPKIGMPVEITSGPFAGLIGKIKRSRTGDRMDVLLKMFNSEQNVTIPLANLKESK
jgi:transcriptional antiterminator RfaH